MDADLNAAKRRFHALRVADLRRETRDSVSIALEVPDGLKPVFAFTPGQYVTLRAVIDGEEVRRAYSICSGLLDGELRVGVKHVRGGAFSTFANERLARGDLIEAMPPDGRFIADLARKGRHVLGVAAGSGITPVLSIVKSLLAGDPTARVTLVYGNRTSQAVMFAETIEALKNQYIGRLSVVHVLSREAQDVALLSGRITGDKLGELARGVIDVADLDEAFLCGPQGMVEDARTALIGLGLAADRIHVELFTPAPLRARHQAAVAEAPTERAPIAQVTVTLDGKRHVVDFHADDDNVVDAAARAGVELPYSCKGGMCCTCRCRVESGTADMAVNYSLEEWELKAGFVLGCQTRPTGPTLALDFDQM